MPRRFPMCFDYVKALFRRLDVSHTDVRSRDVPVIACTATRDFLLVCDEGFNGAIGYLQFADTFVDAREHDFKRQSI